MGIFPDFIKWRGGNKWPTGKITATRKDVEDLMIPPDDAERKIEWSGILSVFYLTRVVRVDS